MQEFKASIHRSLHLCLAFLALYLMVAMGSYHQADGGWSHTGYAVHLHNQAGFLGAWVADFAFFMLGYVAFFLPLVLLFWGLFSLVCWPLFGRGQD